MTSLITSAFRGFSAPVKELYDSIHEAGWSVEKVALTGDQYKATAKDPESGTKIEGVGPTDNAALGHLLMEITKYQSIAHQAKLSKWEKTWEDELQYIAMAYAEAPIYDPKAVSGWKELADDSDKRAEAIAREIKVELVNDPVPYLSVDDMIEDVRDKQKIKISIAGTEHPIWSSDEVLAFRLVHNVIGHCAGGGGWGWKGENLATAAHMAVLDPVAQKALFTETIGQSAFTAYYGTSVQKITFLEELIDEAQKSENKPGWGGTHPSQTVLPGKIPSIEKEGSFKFSSDPNEGWRSLVDPLPTNAYLWTRDNEGRDPLNLPGLRENVSKLDSKWPSLSKADGQPDEDSQKQAVANAFRAILLAPRKSLRDAVTHYQDIAHIPATVDDPIRYWKTLESRRDEFNQGRGLPPGFHRDPWDAEVREFRSWIKGLNPELDDEEVYEVADRQIFHMIAEEEERIETEEKGNEMSASDIETKALRGIQKRLKRIIKPNYDEKTDFGDELAKFGSADEGVYPSFLVSRLKVIAGVSHSLDEIHQAALADLSEGGSGHIFRRQVLDLEIPGIGPQEASYAWMILSPKTTQLAVIDDTLAEMLGYKEQPNDRDYFKLERQLAAGRDASGYGHIPLGQFGWALWNNRKFGQGVGADYSALRPVSPRPRSDINWDEYPRFQEQWEEPEWWRETEEVRDMIGKHWDRTIAPSHPSDTIPKLSKTAGAGIPSAEPFVMEGIFSSPVGVRFGEISGLNTSTQVIGAIGYVGGEPVLPLGFLTIDKGRGTVELVVVDPQARGKGLASKLIQVARDYTGLPLDQASSERSDMGIGFAESAGIGFPNDQAPVDEGEANSWWGSLATDFSFGGSPEFYWLDSYNDEGTEKVSANETPQPSPWFINETGEELQGEPGQTLMRYLRDTYGLTTQEIWKLQTELGKRV
jgi:GNAT superfamily N-acetyltransferase